MNQKYTIYILIALIIILFILIMTLVAVIVQSGNVTMVESGNYYYHLQDVI